MILFFRNFIRILLKPILTIFIILSIIPCLFSYKKLIYNNPEKVPDYDIVCLLGAKVYPNNILSPVIKQRCDTIIKLTKSKKNKIIFVSSSGKYEVDNIADYLIKNGIGKNSIIRDNLGYDTFDTIRHLKKNNYNNILFISQSFHLYRVMDMCKKEKIRAWGLKAEKVSPAAEDIPLLIKYKIRIKRYYKNSFLFILFRLNLYNFFSKEAEKYEL